jgi:hypothetical protein
MQRSHTMSTVATRYAAHPTAVCLAGGREERDRDGRGRGFLLGFGFGIEGGRIFAALGCNVA